MTPPAPFLSAAGRIAPKPFALGAVTIYLLIFFSQMLLSPAVTARAGIAPFAVAQAVLTYGWFVLHARRLHDADRSIGGAVGIAILYALAVVLFILLFEVTIGTNVTAGKNPGDATVGSFIIVLFLIALLTADPNVGIFFYVALAILVMIFAPVIIAVIFSVIASLRHPAAAVP